MVNRWNDLGRPPLRERELRRALTDPPEAFWRVLDVVEVTGSTNADLARRARDGDGEGAVLVAEQQTAGRGRRDRTWESPPRAGLAISVLLRPGVPPDRWSWLTLLAGVAVTDAVRRTCGLEATLKWPNDVLVPADGRPDRRLDGLPGENAAKLAGLLAEVVHTPTGNAVVLGIGINVSQDAGELPVPGATSLTLAGSATTDRDTVLRAVLRCLADRYRDWIAADGDPRAGLAAAYRERCATIGRTVRVHLPDSSVREGLVDGVDDEGRLLLSSPVGAAIQALSAGDVVHIRT